MRTLGVDTSNYTTSAAVFDAAADRMESRGILLKVGAGERGLRQSDAVFAHTKNLPQVFDGLIPPGLRLDAVGVSDAPREAEGSYMPCFLSGVAAASAAAAAAGAPLFRFSHQQGHVAAAAWSAGRSDLLDAPFLAWHLSGGTTELLLCVPDRDRIVSCRRVGGSTDLSAGQAVDRTGVRLGIGFPCGRELDRLAIACAEPPAPARLSVRDTEMSLSGLENQAGARIERGEAPDAVAAFVLGTAAESVRRATEAARQRFGPLPVLFSGGVSSSRFLRARLGDLPSAVFGTPAASADNAMGIAWLTAAAARRRNESEQRGAYGPWTPSPSPN